MVRGKGKTKVLTVGEIQGLKEEKAEVDATLKHLEQNPGTSRAEGIDKNALKKQSGYLQGVIDGGSPTHVRGLNKDRLATEASDLREKLQKNMPTHDEMDHPGRNPGSVAKHIKWSKTNEPNIRRYKEIMRSLEPEDPTATDLERLRREK